MNIALYPGAFKPPTKGHLGVVTQVLSGKYNTAEIDRETGKYEKVTDNPKMDQVWVIIGDMVKGGPNKQKGDAPEVAVGQDEALAVWQEYLKANNLEGQVKLYRAGQVREDVLNEDVGYVCEGANPVRDTYGLLKDKYIRGEYEGTSFFPIVGFRPDNAEALTDLKRMDAAAKKYSDEGLQILVVLDEPTPGEESVSATKLRAALAAGDEKEIERYAAAPAKELLKHFPKQDALDAAIAEVMLRAVDDMLAGKMPTVEEIVEQVIEEKKEEKIEESRPDMPSPDIEDIGRRPSEYTSKLHYFKDYFQNLTNFPVVIDKYGNIVIQTSERVPMNETKDISEVTSPELNFTPFLSSILEFMLDKKMRITPIPNIEIKMDTDAATDVFGPTAYYDPSSATVCLYVLGRHPKDVLRSFCHEMIHHMQNMEGRLPAFGTTNTQEDSVLNEIEKEAHALGSMTFREWEDTVKNNFDVVKEEVVSEKRGKLNPFAKKLTTIAFDLIKSAHENGSAVLDKYLYVGPDEEMDIESDIEFDFRIFMERGPYNYTGGADNADIPDEEGDYQDPYLMVSATLPDDFTNWSELYMDLLDVIRHELEHLKQGGPNVRQGGWMEDDSAVRGLIKVGLLPEKEYYKLEKEVDAMIQGLWLHAKKVKKPLIQVIDRYLSAQDVSGEDRKEVLAAWSKRLPALGVTKDQRF